MRKWHKPIRRGDRVVATAIQQLLVLVFVTVLSIGCPSGGSGGDLVSVNSTSLPIPVGASETFTATSSNSYDTFTWSSSDESVATVSPNGVVLALAEGNTVIRAQGSNSGVGGVAMLTVVSAGASMLIWDGENGWTGNFGSLNTSRPYRGNACFEGVPGQWTPPTADLNGYASYQQDISDFDEIWFFGAVSEVGKTFSISFYGWPHTSNGVGVNSYVEGGGLDTSWRLVRIPIAGLVTADYQLEKIERILFGVADPTAGHSIYVDEVWAVDVDAFGSDGIPLMGSVHGVDFGNVTVQFSTFREITLTNAGSATLSINKVSLTGDHADEFVVAQDPFTIEPGATHDLTITFEPQPISGGSDGNKSATLMLAHDFTPMGSATEIPLSGRAISPAISLSSDTLNFGGVPDGLVATRTLMVSNPGNQTLRVSSISTSDPAFGATPVSFNVAAGGNQVVTATFNPSATTTFNETLTVLSDVYGSESLTVGLSGSGLPNGATGSLPVEMADVTSSTVALSWPSFDGGAATVNVYLGPEPPATVDAALSTQKLLASLGGNATAYVAENLAASVDSFFHVEVRDGGGSLIAQGNAHARTLGGPGTTLNGPVREVHMVAPNIMQIVIADMMVHSYSADSDLWDQGVDELVGYTGAAWQAGPWTVTRNDGTPIQVLNVYRDSVPVGNNYYEIGWQSNPRDHRLDVDHQIYLELATSVDGPDVLSVNGPEVTGEVMDLESNRTTRTVSADFVLPFSDRYLETPVIQLNQVGYSPRATERWAYISGWLGDGGPLALDGFPSTVDVLVDPDEPMDRRQAVLSGLPITLRAVFDDDAGTEVHQIDLAAVPASEGTVYRVHIPGIGVSWPTQVSETAVFKSFYTVARGLYHNRFGRDLQTQWTEWAPRPPDHTTIYTAESDTPMEFFPANTPLSGARTFSGGHHDAGDFDIRLFHTGVAMVLLGAYEVNADLFTDGQLTIPESGNGIPDFLDEILWNVAAWEQLQEADGGVRMGVESFRHPWGNYYADIETPDKMPYWTYSRDPIHSVRVAALFAQTARLVAPFDQSKADELENRAVMAYNYAISHGVSEATGGPVVFAWSELYRLTGEQQYRNQFEAVWNANDPYGTGMSILQFNQWLTSFFEASQPTFIHNVMGYLGASEVDPVIYGQSVTKFTGNANAAYDDLQNLHAHRNGRQEGTSPSWGAGSGMAQYLFRIHARLQMGDTPAPDVQKYFNAISMAADYVLGANPLGMVWITGLGSRNPQDPLHLDAMAFKKDGFGLIPGIPVYGPTNGLPGFPRYDYGANTMYPVFDDRPLMRHYADIHTWVAHNEFDNGTQTSHTDLFSRLIAPGMSPPASWLPGGSEHRNSLAPREGIVPNP